MSDLVDAYLNNCRNVRRLSNHTVRACQNDLGQFIAGLPIMEQLEPFVIQNRLKKIAEDHRLAPRTVRRRFAAVKSFIRAIDPYLAARTFMFWKLSVRSPVNLPKQSGKRN